MFAIDKLEAIADDVMSIIGVSPCPDSDTKLFQAWTLLIEARIMMIEKANEGVQNGL